MFTILLNAISLSDFCMKMAKGMNGIMNILKGVAAEMKAP
jgi:hypothetical protein